MKDRYLVTLIALSILAALALSAFAPVPNMEKKGELPKYKNVSFTVINKTEERLIVYMEGVERGFKPRLMVDPGTKFTPNRQTWRVPNDIYKVQTWYGTSETNAPAGKCCSKVNSALAPTFQLVRYYNVTKPTSMVVDLCEELPAEVETLYEQNIAEGVIDTADIYFNWSYKFVY